jgi:hypothetical protein
MATLEETKQELTVLWTSFVADCEKFMEKGNKSAGARSRKTSMAIDRSLKKWRQQSLAFTQGE